MQFRDCLGKGMLLGERERVGVLDLDGVLDSGKGWASRKRWEGMKSRTRMHACQGDM